MNSFRLHFPDCEKVNRLSLFQIAANITLFCFRNKNDGQGSAKRRNGRGEEKRGGRDLIVVFVTYFSQGNGFWICIFLWLSINNLFLRWRECMFTMTTWSKMTWRMGRRSKSLDGRWDTQIHLRFLQKTFYIKYEFVLPHCNVLQQ